MIVIFAALVNENYQLINVEMYLCKNSISQVLHDFNQQHLHSGIMSLYLHVCLHLAKYMGNLYLVSVRYTMGTSSIL